MEKSFKLDRTLSICFFGLDDARLRSALCTVDGYKISTELSSVQFSLPVNLDIALPHVSAATRFCTHYLHYLQAISRGGKTPNDHARGFLTSGFTKNQVKFFKLHII